MDANSYAQAVSALREAIDQADAIVIGAGAGLSTAAGLTYSGERFERYFGDFIEKHHFRDMYSAGFYPFRTLEEQWAFWSRLIWCNRYESTPKDTCGKLFGLLRGKDFFVITTNVDHRFQMAGFPKDRLFYTQGDYGLWQCSVPCHKKTYDNYKTVKRMMLEQRDLRVPSELVPYCPVCGKPMSMNLRADDAFVEDEGWHAAANRYQEFLDAHQEGKILYLELGVGGNTPIIIKYPFWRFTAANPQAVYACVNLGEAYAHPDIREQSILVDADIDQVLDDLLGPAGTSIASDAPDAPYEPLGEERKRELLCELVGVLSGERGYAALADADVGELWITFRALVNTRPPDPIDGGWLAKQDELLHGMIAETGISTPDDAFVSPDDSRMRVWRGDITTLAVDAIVNAANSQMLGCWVPGHHCIDNAIHTFAGVQLRAECACLMEAQGHEEPTGSAKITAAYNLPSRHVIHTVGPIAGGYPTDEHRTQLASCYRSCLDLAAENSLHSIAFCGISTGIFGFPQEEAAKIAVQTVRDWLAECDADGHVTDMTVVFNVFTKDAEDIYRSLAL